MSYLCDVHEHPPLLLVTQMRAFRIETSTKITMLKEFDHDAIK